MLDRNLLAAARSNMAKLAFTASPELMAQTQGQAPGAVPPAADPAMGGGGALPADPAAAGLDPAALEQMMAQMGGAGGAPPAGDPAAMAQGAPPPVDPAMAAGDPTAAGGVPPMPADPSMAAPPPAPAGGDLMQMSIDDLYAVVSDAMQTVMGQQQQAGPAPEALDALRSEFDQRMGTLEDMVTSIMQQTGIEPVQNTERVAGSGITPDANLDQPADFNSGLTDEALAASGLDKQAGSGVFPGQERLSYDDIARAAKTLNGLNGLGLPSRVQGQL